MNSNNSNNMPGDGEGDRLGQQPPPVAPLLSADGDASCSQNIVEGSVEDPRDDSCQAGSSVSQHQEIQLERDTRMLLHHYLQERAALDNPPNAQVIRESALQDPLSNMELSDESRRDIVTTIRRLGDLVSNDMELERLIEQIPSESTQEIFWKVCEQVFLDQDYNWGRVVTVFYFAYRLIVRKIQEGFSASPWINKIVSWAVDFIIKYVGSWIISRGGWRMVREWLGVSNFTFSVLSCLTFLMLAYFSTKRN